MEEATEPAIYNALEESNEVGTEKEWGAVEKEVGDKLTNLEATVGIAADEKAEQGSNCNERAEVHENGVESEASQLHPGVCEVETTYQGLGKSSMKEKEHLTSKDAISSDIKSDKEGKDDIDKEDTIEMSFRGKLIRTACAQAAYLAVTLNLGMIGPSMLDLEILTKSTTQEMSTVFTWRAVLGLIASLVLGPLLDHLNKFFVVGVALAADVVFIAVAPWTTHIAALLATMAPPEFFNSAIGMGTHLICISLWGAGSGPSLQALNLMATIGYALSPLLCKPFLAPSQLSIDHNSSQLAVSNLSLSNGIHSQSVAYNIFHDNRSSRTDLLMMQEPETKIQFAYLIVAVYDLVIACLIFAIFIKDGAKIYSKEKKESEEEAGGKKRSKKFVVTICVLFYLFNVFYGGIEVGYAGLLMTFAVKYLGWSKDDGTNVTALLQISNAVVTAAAIFVSRWVRAQTMLLGSIGIVTTAMVVLSLTVERTPVTLWLCTACLGIGYATIMPCSYTWVNDVMQVTGKFSSAYWAGFFTGFMIVPAITGQLFYHVHPMWLPYGTLICSFGMLIFFVVISIFIWRNDRQLNESENMTDKK